MNTALMNSALGSTFFTSALLSVRLLPLLVVAPIAPLARVPLTARVLLSMAIALIIGSSLAGLEVDKTVPFFLLLLTEFLIGATLAFSIHSAHAALHSMGHVLDMQIGFSAASLLAPGTQHMSTPTAEVLSIAIIFVVFFTHIHQDLIIGFARICEIVPPGTSVAWNWAWLKVIGSLYMLGLLITGPVILVLWLTDVTLAFISRSLPQVPVYFIGLPVKIGVGLIAMSWLFTQALESIIRLLSASLDAWGNALTVQI